MKFVLALGLFDGVHRGHMAILRETAAFAAEMGATPAVLTFDELPKSGGRITDFLTQKRLIGAETSVQKVFSLAFSEHIRQMPPENFIRFLQQMGAVGLVAGENFRFGAERRGDTALLHSHMPCRVLPPVTDDTGAPISSTRIRALLAQGELTEAAKLLGRPYTRVAPVQRGASRGRHLGFATMNLPHGPSLLRLPAGVYASILTANDGIPRQGVTNFGFSPTFGQGTEYRSETHVFDYQEQLYGRVVKLEVIQFLRPEVKFDGPAALIAQMEDDAKQAKRCLEGVLGR